MPETVEIANKLRGIDPVRYARVIQRAEAMGYHDFKFTNDAAHTWVFPKLQLLNDVSQFPELHWLYLDVMNGDYDEGVDNVDSQAMRISLIKFGATDVLFTALGLQRPTQLERILRLSGYLPKNR